MEKLEEAERQKQKLQEEVMALCEKVETARIDAVQKFKASQSFIDFVPTIMALGLMIALNKLRQLSQSWTYRRLQWMLLSQ